MRRSFPAEPERLADIRTFVRVQANDASLSDDGGNDLAAAVSEACANVIEHTSSEHIDITVRGTPRLVEVGVGESAGRARHPHPAALGAGYGFEIMRALADEVHIDRGTQVHPGLTVRLIKYARLPRGADRYRTA